MALKYLQPLLSTKLDDAIHRRPSAMLAAYGIGVVHYQARDLDGAIKALRLFFEIKVCIPRLLLVTHRA